VAKDADNQSGSILTESTQICVALTLARQLPPVQSISAASVQQRQPTPLTAPCSK